MMMLYGLCQLALERIPAPVGAVGCGGLFFLTWPVYGGYLMLFGQRIYLPDFLYRQPLLFPLGFSCPGISSADYYPLMPWGFLFLAGAFLGRYVKAGVLPELCYRRHLPVLGWLGRHTMAIYLVHQPVIFGVLTLLFAAGA